MMTEDVFEMPAEYRFEVHEYSEWECALFGATTGNGITWRPLKGAEPNWFWRKMQFLVFGNRWKFRPQ